MTLQTVDKLFKYIVFLFAISFHESAHAWMANRRGDPTARMLGRVTLNPIKHIDPVGTVLLPLVALFTSVPLLGWAKPTPVDPRNFKNVVLDDILTSVVGPASNFLLATVSLLLLAFIKSSSAMGQQVVFGLLHGWISPDATSVLLPACLLLYELMFINVLLGVFNLIPVPPLDGSHVLRHFLPTNALRIYDTMGIFALMALVFLAPGLLSRIISPVVGIFNYFLLRI
jgi:Zn-dependent protease